MNEKTKAACNLHAVLRNMENLCELDITSKELIAASNVAIQFSVPEIDKLVLAFRQGTCKAMRGDGQSYDMNLRFSSHEHLNLMIEGKKNPLPTKGLRHISFLKKTFTALADRLSYYLQPDLERLQNDKSYRDASTKMLAYTAFYAIPEIARYDEVGVHVARQIDDGIINIVVGDEFAIQIHSNKGVLEMHKGRSHNARAIMLFDSMDTASGILNGTLDSFGCIGTGALAFRGRITMIDNLNRLLGIVPNYLG
ncbi:MAG: hypothetical protein GX939_07510 [Clostridiaceae bacterium]|mgnify:FL=1|jgi:hypothetical protein|nr:hypothetical protein [Clostridiaceae bacterium]